MEIQVKKKNLETSEKRYCASRWTEGKPQAYETYDEDFPEGSASRARSSEIPLFQKCRKMNANKSDLYERLMQYSLRIISKKRYTVCEISKKTASLLKKWRINDDGLIEKIILRLKELEYLNDDQFLKDYVSDRIRYKPRGKMLLRRELKFKGINQDAIDDYFKSNEIDEESISSEMINRKKNKWLNYSLQRQKMKAYQYLYSKGFDRDAIYKAIDRCYNH